MTGAHDDGGTAQDHLAVPPIDVALVRTLIDGTFPQWSALPVRAVLPGGNDNRTFRLGDHLAVRLPSAAGYVAAVEKEQRWLPRLAPGLPLPIPEPVGLGRPAAGYPWPWTVNRWLPGDAALEVPPADQRGFARDLAGFLRALHALDATEGPRAGAHSFHRGGDLAVYATETAEATAGLRDPELAAWAARTFEKALDSRWTAPPVWVHGDIAPGNLLVTDGRLSAVVDFGTSAVGDPAADAVIAWTWFDREAAAVFRDEVDLDRDTWDRAAGWALWKALISLGGPSEDTAWRTIRRLREG